MSNDAEAALLDRDAQHLIHPLHSKAVHATGKVWVGGEGAYLTDANGDRFIDGLSGLWNNTAGNGRSELVEAGSKQLAEMAYASGYAGSSNPRAIELGAVYNVSILVASSTGDAPGTLIHGEADVEVRNKVRGVTYDLDVAKITLRGIPDQPGVAANLFQPLADAGISVDTIVQNASLERLTDLTFTVSRQDVKQALAVAQPTVLKMGATECLSDDTLGNVSIVGTGMQNVPGCAARMFQALYEAGINIEIITTSEIRITCIVAQDRVHDAVRALHKAFELDHPAQPS